MITKIGKHAFRVFAFDFETHNDDESIKANTSSIWLGSIINEYNTHIDNNIYFYSIKGFFENLKKLQTLKRKKANDSRPVNNLLLYAYNLSFEWSFILPYLLKNNFKWKAKIDKHDLNNKCYSSISTHSCSSVWTASITLGNGFQILFRDLAKIYGGGLSRVAKSFNLKTQKGEIDYRLNRLHNYQVTPAEKLYNFNDNKIVMDILEINKGDSIFWKSSSSSSYAALKMVDFGYGNYRFKMRGFRNDYPIPTVEEYNFLRDSVSGGITYAPERWQFKTVTNVKHIDAHQMHPSQGYLHLFPYGCGKHGLGKPPLYFSKIYCVKIKLSYTGVKLHSIIKCIGIDAIENVELTVWNFEIPTILKCYENAKIKYIEYYEYSSKFLPWREFYAENYRKRKIARKKGDGYNVVRYKLLNNSSYGKLLEKPHNEQYENVLDRNLIITSNTHLVPPSKVKLCSKFTALGVGACIPAYSRVQLIETALKFGYKNILYFDTDSIFYVNNFETKKAFNKLSIGDDLGTWGVEPDIKKFQVTAPKRYKMEMPDSSKCVVMAGVNNINTNVPFEEINIVSNKFKVKQAYRCVGGTLIKICLKEIGVQKKYAKTFETNK